MKQKYFYLLTLLLLSFLGIGQTTTLPYNDDIYTNGFPSVNRYYHPRKKESSPE